MLQKRMMISHSDKYFILEQALDRVIGIILLILVKKAGPAIRGHKIFWMKITYVSSVAVGLMTSISIVIVSADMVSTRTVNWTSRSPRDISTEQLHHDRNHAQLFGWIRVLALGLDNCS